MNVDLSMAVIHDREGIIELWYVTGIPDRFYPTKIVAEMAARQRFPDEDRETNYQRVLYKKFHRELDVSTYLVVFNQPISDAGDENGDRMYVMAVDVDHAIGIALRLNPTLTYNDIVDHMEV